MLLLAQGLNPSMRHDAPNDHIPEHVRTYIDTHLESARHVGRLYGIPVPVILAVGGLESGWGGSLLAREANNHFGIKAGSWKGPVYVCQTSEHGPDGAVRHVMAHFRQYDCVEDCFEDFARMICSGKRFEWMLNIPLATT
jgi:flagellum-specific peptidoglycan hydrolase FlgJ